MKSIQHSIFDMDPVQESVQEPVASAPVASAPIFSPMVPQQVRTRPNLGVPFGSDRARKQTPEQLTELLHQFTSRWSIDLAQRTMPQLSPRNFRNIVQHKDQYYVGPTSFGTKYWLYCTTIQQRPFTFMISKRNQEAFSLKMTFPEYTESIFDCEMGRNESGQWQLIFSDAIVAQNEAIDHLPIQQRYHILQQFLQHAFPDKGSIYGTILLNQYYPLPYLADLMQRSAKHVPFRMSGLIFRHLSIKANDLLYVFQEHKTHRVEQPTPVPTSVPAPLDPASEEKQEIQEEESKTAVFRVDRCPALEKYTLTCQRDSELIRHGYACVQTIATSHLLLYLFYDEQLRLRPMRTGPHVECSYHPVFKRWQPIQVTTQPLSSLHHIMAVQDASS